MTHLLLWAYGRGILVQVRDCLHQLRTCLILSILKNASTELGSLLLLLLLLLLLQVDDQLAELFLSEEPIDADQLAAAIRRATLANKFAPVFMGSAYKNKGKPAPAVT
jgi:hypothetical protein